MNAYLTTEAAFDQEQAVMTRMIRHSSSVVALATCCLLTLALKAAAQEQLATNPGQVGVSCENVNELSEFMQSLVDDGKIAGGVTMMARHDKVVHLEAVGMADRKGKKPMTTDAIFRIASMTKPITSVAVMMLWEDGKLKLDDPVSKYIPEFRNPQVLVSVDPWKTRPAKSEIKIRHLLTHTSGLGYEFSKQIGPIYHEHGIHCGSCTIGVTLEQMMKKLGPLPLLFDPGEKWQYGMNNAVQGRVVEVASGMTLDRFVEQQICRPLGMRNTLFKIPAEKIPRLATAYVPAADSIRPLEAGEFLNWKLGTGTILMSSDYPYSNANKCVLGGGNLCSTPTDYMRLCQMFLNKGKLGDVRLLRADTVEMMTSNQVGDLRGKEGYGFGFGVTPDTQDSPKRLRSSYYWHGGWSTSFRISPSDDWAVIAMSQVAWNDSTLTWIAKYEKIAADSIID